MPSNSKTKQIKSGTTTLQSFLHALCVSVVVYEESRTLKVSKIVGKQRKSKESSDTSTAFRKTCEPTKTGSWVRTTPKTKSLVGSGPAADRDRPRGARQGLILILLRGLIASPKRRPVRRVSSARSRRAPTVWGPVSPGRGRLGRIRVASDPRSSHE